LHRIIYKSIHARYIGLYVFTADQIERHVTFAFDTM